MSLKTPRRKASPVVHISSMTKRTTPRTSRGRHTKSLDRLPSEILYRILRLLANSHKFHTLANLLQTNHAMYNYTLPYIYKDVHFSSKRSFRALLKALDTPTSRSSLKGVKDEKGKWITGTQEQLSGRRLMENFKMTKRITLRDMPYYSFGQALVEWRKSRGPPSNQQVIFPGAELLTIVADRLSTDASSGQKIGPSSLGILCTPKHICVILGSSASTSKIDGEVFFLDSIIWHLRRGTWPAPADIQLHIHKQDTYHETRSSMMERNCAGKMIHRMSEISYYRQSRPPTWDMGNEIDGWFSATTAVAWVAFDFVERLIMSKASTSVVPLAFYFSNISSAPSFLIAIGQVGDRREQCLQSSKAIDELFDSLCDCRPKHEKQRKQMEEMLSMEQDIDGMIGNIDDSAEKLDELVKTMVGLVTSLQSFWDDQLSTEREIQEALVVARSSLEWSARPIEEGQDGERWLKDVAVKFEDGKKACPSCSCEYTLGEGN